MKPSLDQNPALPGPASLDVRAALKAGMAQLRAAQVPSHTLAAELLLISVLGCDRAWLYAHPEQTVEPAAVEQYLEHISRRATGTPTQYLTGRQEFWGLEFEVGPGVLIPRPESEHLIEEALARLSAGCRERQLTVADVGTGSGCLAVALAHELPRGRIFATDISAQALAYAQRNARRHNVASRIHFVQASLLEPFAAPAPLFDLVVCNPPYVGRAEAALLPREVREHEPEVALFAGDRGGKLYSPLVAQSGNALRPGGVLVFELGYNSLRWGRAPVEEAGWGALSVVNDLAGVPRVLSAVRR